MVLQWKLPENVHFCRNRQIRFMFFDSLVVLLLSKSATGSWCPPVFGWFLRPGLQVLKDIPQNMPEVNSTFLNKTTSVEQCLW